MWNGEWRAGGECGVAIEFEYSPVAVIDCAIDQRLPD
jgi:hypothetical protein